MKVTADELLTSPEHPTGSGFPSSPMMTMWTPWRTFPTGQNLRAISVSCQQRCAYVSITGWQRQESWKRTYGAAPNRLHGVSWEVLRQEHLIVRVAHVHLWRRRGVSPWQHHQVFFAVCSFLRLSEPPGGFALPPSAERCGALAKPCGFSLSS